MSEVDYEAVAKHINHFTELQGFQIKVEFGEKGLSLKIRSKERINPESKRAFMRLIWPILLQDDAVPGWVEWRIV